MEAVKAWLKNPAVWLIPLALVGLTLFLIGDVGGGGNNGAQPNPGKNGNNGTVAAGEKIDDWQYDPDAQESGSISRNSATSTSAVFSGSAVAADAALGFSAGGAKDIDNFRRNIDAGYLPSPADLSHEGLYYDYFFETGPAATCDQLFCPSYATAVSPDPFSEQDEHFLAVGLNSNLRSDDFARKDLNLVVVLDISGSMSTALDAYYYDQPGFLSPEPTEDSVASKMEVANRSLVALLQHLTPADRLGIVLFDDQAYVAKDLRLVAETDMEAIASHILEIVPAGGTNMEAGYLKASELLSEYQAADAADYENRIIFLTDAMPNVGNLDRQDLAGLAAEQAEEGVYTSFIGIGLDFNAELVQAITQTRGANYFSVHSDEEFKQRLDQGFEYMVTPLVFDLNLKVVAEGYKIKAVYGSPEADLASGEIMRVNTLFPSLRVDNQTRGGLILLHLDKIAEAAELELEVTYSDRAGEQHSNRQQVDFPDSTPPFFAHNGIRKGIVLARLVNTWKAWLAHESGQVALRPSDYVSEGIPVGHEPISLGYWERTSRPLKLSEAYRPIITGLRDYFVSELPHLDDESLKRELGILELILGPPPADLD